MPPFNSETLSPLTEEREDETESKDESEQEQKKSKEKGNGKDVVNAADLDSFSNLPYPIIIDPGAAETVLPKGWCKQAEMLKNNSGRTYSAANGGANNERRTQNRRHDYKTKTEAQHDMPSSRCHKAISMGKQNMREWALSHI